VYHHLPCTTGGLLNRIGFAKKTVRATVGLVWGQLRSTDPDPHLSQTRTGGSVIVTNDAEMAAVRNARSDNSALLLYFGSADQPLVSASAR
jgi:hypothetical protein